MRIEFVEMNDECRNIFLSIPVGHEFIDILSPFLNVFLSMSIRVISTLLKVYLLIPERQFPHSFP